MNLCYSTLGCPGWDFAEALSAARDLGYDGIEIRGVGSEIYAPSAKQFLLENIDATMNKINSMKLEISCFTTGCFLFDEANNERYLQEGRDYIDLAHKTKTPYIRVLADKNPAPEGERNEEIIIKSLNILSNYAEGKNVTVLIETNGMYASSDRIFSLIEKVDAKNIGILWDVHHPYRYMGESVSHTYNKLKKHIKYIHVKDSIMLDGKVAYKMAGHGDIPLKEAVSLLKQDDYTGYISLEWVKRWNMELEEPGIVFSGFVDYMKKILR
jgi:sugar phosphate isomerase/epimerase